MSHVLANMNISIILCIQLAYSFIYYELVKKYTACSTKVVRLVVLLSQLNYSVDSWLQLVSFSYAVNGATLEYSRVVILLLARVCIQ